MKKSIKSGIGLLISVMLLTGCGKSHATDSIKEFSVHFDTTGGSVVRSQLVVDGETINVPSDPSKEGYTFNGWYLDGKKFDFSTPISNDVKLEARWIKGSTYTVSFKDGSTTTTKAVAVNGVVSEPAEPTKDGYVFLGWYNGNTKYDFSSKVNKDLSLTAKWEKIGGSENSNETNNKKPGNTSNTGNKGNGNSTVNNSNNNNSSNNNTNNQSDYNKEVSFVVEHYQMNLNGGYDKPIEVENFKTLNNYVVVPKVKSYVGFTAPVPETITVTEGSNIVVKYYYTRNKYTINVSADPGLEVTGSGDYFYGQVVNVSAKPLAGYDFAGWDNGTKDATFSYIVGTTNMTFRALSTPHKYTVKFDANGGVGSMTDMEFVYGNTVALNKNTFIKKFMITYNIDGTKTLDEEALAEFKGWSTSKDGSTGLYPDLGSVSNLTPVDGGEVILYAIWDRAVTALNMDVKRAGYTLVGWSTDGNKDNLISNFDKYELNQDVTLYGIWDVIPIVENINFSSVCSDHLCQNPINLDILKQGEDTFYLRIPVGTYIDLNSINFNFNTEVELNYNTVSDSNYLEFIPTVSNRVSLGSHVFNLVTTDNKNYRNFIPGTTNIYEISDFITWLNGRKIGIVEGFAKDNNNEFTSKYVTSTVKKNGVWYIFFNKVDTDYVTLTYKNGDKTIGTIEVPMGSIMPEVGDYEIVGYNFNGWYMLDENNNQIPVNYDLIINEDLTIYGDYTEKTDVDTTWYDSSLTTFVLNNFKQLNGLNKLLNEGVSFSGKTINLGSDIDLANLNWQPIKGFNGTFDGQNHTIANLTIKDHTHSAGFFESLDNATVRNIKFTGVNIDSPIADGVGVLTGSANKVTIERIYVADIINLIGKSKVGGLIGEMTDTGTTSKITECEIGSGTITAHSGYLGGIVGLSKGYKSAISNIIVNANLVNLGGDESFTSGIIGYHDGKQLSLSKLIFTGTLKSDATNPVDELYGIYQASSKPFIGNLYYINGEGDGHKESAETLKNVTTYSSFDVIIWQLVDGSYPTLKWKNN